MPHHALDFFRNYNPSSKPTKQSLTHFVKLSHHRIPNSIVFLITGYIPLTDYFSLFLVNSKWNSILNQEEYWQNRFMDEFSSQNEQEGLNLFDASDKGVRAKTWKHLYILRFKYESIHQKWQLPLLHPEFQKALGHVLVIGTKSIGATTLHNAILHHRFDDRTTIDSDQDLATPVYRMGSSEVTMYYSNFPFSSHAVIDVILYLFDLSNAESLEYILKNKDVEMSKKSWYDECQVVLVGLKSDLKKDNKLSYKAFDACVQKGWTYLELSCKTRIEQVEVLEHMCVFYTIQRINRQM